MTNFEKLMNPITVKNGEIEPFQLNQLNLLINEAIDDYSIKTLKDDDQRTHLGVSEIGEECSRKLWYKFRWMFIEEFDGRMHRLFKRGHREEAKFISILEGIGFNVFRHDENGKQFRCTGVMGHYGGSCDGVGIAPWLPNFPFLLEFKTHNEKSFVKYAKDGLLKSKPQHFDQMSGYGQKMKIDYGLYFPENKNDDDIKPVFIKLDHQRALQLERKAEEIIKAKIPPQRISDNPSYYKCKDFNCAAFKICHEGATPIKNCRSCRNATPVEDAQWHCALHDGIIPKEFVVSGCSEWVPI